MTRRVWKFELAPAWRPEVRMPAGAEVLSVGAQREQLFVWAACDVHAPLVARAFIVAGTGQDLPEGIGRFVGTTHMQTTEGVFVWHVWEAA